MKNNSNDLLNSKGYYIYKIKNQSPLKKAKDILNNSNHSLIKSNLLFDKMSLNLQKKLYNKKTHIKIFKNEFKYLKKILNLKSLSDVMITSFFHLRAVKNERKKNFLGFHRETFYSDFEYTSKQINISVPILNYNKQNSLKIIPKSHLIPDKKIKTKKLSSKISKIKKNSIKHKLGLAYNPHKILSGVNLKKAKRAELNVGKLIAFSAMLIHGNGKNNSKKVRYSIDFGIINKKFLKKEKIKKHHISYSKNQNYWINI